MLNVNDTKTYQTRQLSETSTSRHVVLLLFYFLEPSPILSGVLKVSLFYLREVKILSFIFFKSIS